MANNSFNIIKNQALSRMITLLKKAGFNQGIGFRTKVYEGEYHITLQIKSSVTKQCVRIAIDKDCNLKKPLIKIEHRDRNPNTWEFVSMPFTVKKTNFIDDAAAMEEAAKAAVSFVGSESAYSKVEFQLIKTTKDLDNRPGDVCWMGEITEVISDTIDPVTLKPTKVKLKFTDKNVFVSDIKLFEESRWPLVGDYFFFNSRNQFQTLSQAKAKFHYEV